eukprot:m.68497 g.68497  ORF g.68497 m.68497 type:complete len:1352 (+) comp7502_c0_seq1:1214-5269(+)
MPPKKKNIKSGTAGSSKKENKEEIQALLKAKKDAADARAAEEQAKQERQREARARAEAAGGPVIDIIEADYDISKWTGKTPATLLQEMCQRNGWTRPDYRYSAKSGGHTASVYVGKPEASGQPATGRRIGDAARVYRSEIEARHFVAVMALHTLSFDKPLHRLLPPCYRDYWAVLEAQRLANPRTAAMPCEPFAPPPAPPKPAAASRPPPDEGLPLVSMSEAARRIVEDAIHAARDYRSGGTTEGKNVEAMVAHGVSQGFVRAHVEEAVAYAHDNASLLDWLLLHVPEGDLPGALRPKTAELEAFQHTPETLARHYQARKLAALGFPLRQATAALEACADSMAVAWMSLLESLGDGASDAATAALTGEVDAAAVEEELEALQAIYADQLVLDHDADGWTVRVAVKVDTIPGAHSLVVYIPSRSTYPAVAPLVGLESDVPTTIRLSALAALWAAAKEAAGEPLVFTLVALAQEKLADAMATPMPLVALRKFSGPVATQVADSDYGSETASTRGRRPRDRGPQSRATEEARLQKQAASLKDKPITAARARLPVAGFRKQIVDAIRANRVVVVCGETGCGKTTQIPQFVLEDAIARGEGAACSIACTQPRRLSAISVAERVAAERGEGVGATAGYAIRMDAMRSAQTHLLFCTTGLLLRRMQDDPLLSDFTHIFVDEVHERSVDGDYALALLRELAARRADVHIVLMSATLDSAKFAAYYRGAPVVNVPGFTHPVTEFFLDEIVALPDLGMSATAIAGIRAAAGLDDSPSSTSLVDLATDLEDRLALEDDAPRPEDADDSSSDSESEGGPASTPATAPFPAAPTKAELRGINYDLVCAVIGYACRLPDPGAVLVFMPGVAEISRTVRQLQSYAEKNPSIPPLTVLPLHANLTPQDQARVFQPAGAGKRKVIVATNVAETSITIDDVSYVVDSGRVKEIQYDPTNHMSCLVEGWIAQSSARQRQGRAGRTHAGQCFKLYSRRHYAAMPSHQVPEILRVPLEQVVLSIKSLTDQRVPAFLAAMLDSPPAAAVDAAMTALREMRVLDGDEALTPLGQHVARVPADVRVGKVLVFGALLNCLDPVATVAAFSGLRSPFLCPVSQRAEAAAKHARFAVERSDLLAYVRAFEEWEGVRRGGIRAEKAWCEENFISSNVMGEARELRAQYISLMKDAGLAGPDANAHATTVPVIKAALCAGLYPNAAKVVLPQATYYKMSHGAVARPTQSAKIRLYQRAGGRVFIHPGSSLFKEARFDNMTAIYCEKVSTSKVFLRDVTLVAPYPLLLFGGTVTVDHAGQIISVDNWLRFRAPARIAVLANELRKGLDALLLAKIANPDVNLQASPVVNAMLYLLLNEGPA